MKFGIKQFGLAAILTLAFLASAGCADQKNAKLFPNHSLVNVGYKTRNWSACRENGTIVQTNHYRIYTTISNKENHQMLANFMEACLQNYSAITGFEIPQNKFSMYMFATRKQWKFLTDGMFGKSGPASKLQSGGYTLHGVSVCWDIGDMTTFAIASHEGLHQFLYHTLKTPLPLWADEGLATLCEGCKINDNKITFTPSENFVRMSALEEMLEANRFLPLEDFLQTFPENVIDNQQADTLEYYAQLYVTMLFISQHKKYRAGLKKMLADAKAGKLKLTRRKNLGNQSCRTGLNAEFIFNFYITENYERFNEELKRFAKNLVKNYYQKNTN